MADEKDDSDKTKGGRFPWLRGERRATPYKELLSNKMVRLAALVGLYVIIDPRVTIPIGDGSFLKLGGDGFSAELKGVVIGIILSEGYKKMSEFWFGATASGQKTNETMERMAEAAPAAATKATEKALDVVSSLPPVPQPQVAAASSGIQTDTVNVQTDTVNVNETPKA